MASSRVTATIDFEQQGLGQGYLRIPHSTNRSAYGHIAVPIIAASRGKGPTVLLIAGVHGDECEGPIALMRLARKLEPERMNGRVIIVPAINFPAWLHGSRTSPIDGLNLNRRFPGDRDGTPTDIMTQYIETVLLPMADYCFDFHSGGASLRYLPTLIVDKPHWKEQSKTLNELVAAFAPPRILYMDMLGEDRTIAAAAARCGVSFLTGEFGGGGGVDLDGLEMLSRGLVGVLEAIGVWSGDQTFPRPPGGNTVQKLSVRGESDYIFSPCQGIFEPRFRLGDVVEKEQVAGYIHDPNRPWNAFEEVCFANGGLAVCIRALAHVMPGDCLGHLAGHHEDM